MASSARIEELRKKFEENPRRYFAPLANEYRKAGDIEQAIAICREYLPQQPGHMSGHIVYGQALYEARQFDESKSVFETALTLDPENLIALRHLGDIALIVGDTEGARGWYRRVLEADPRNEEIQAQIARLDQGAAPTPAVGAPQAPATSGMPPSATSGMPSPGTPAVASPKPTPSSAPTVVVQAVERPVPAVPSSNPAAAPQHAVTATSATAEVRLDDIPSTPPEAKRAETVAEIPMISTADVAGVAAPASNEPTSSEPVQRLELDSAVPGVAAPETPTIGSFSLEGLETTSLAAAEATSPASAPAESPPAPSAPPLELDMPPANALPTEASAPPPPNPLPELELSVPEPPATTATAMAAQTAAPPAIPTAPEVPAQAAGDQVPELLDLSLPSPPAGAAPQPPATAVPPETGKTTEPAAAAPATVDARSATERDAPAAPSPPVGAPSSGPFVTETMAELYLQQGHRDEALRVYRALLEQRPGDTSLIAKIDALQGPPRAAGAPTIREMLSLVAARRPGSRGAPSHGQNGNAPTASAPGADTVSGAPSGTAAPSAPRAAVAAAADALGAVFGAAASVSEADEAAARMLAQAFAWGDGNSGDLAMSGAPARVASSELSLDAVFATGTETPSAAPSSFSFDQFFSKNASGEGGPAAAQAQRAESESDVAQFTSWLQGLKQK